MCAIFLQNFQWQGKTHKLLKRTMFKKMTSKTNNKYKITYYRFI